MLYSKAAYQRRLCLHKEAWKRLFITSICSIRIPGNHAQISDNVASAWMVWTQSFCAVFQPPGVAHPTLQVDCATIKFTF